VCGIWHAILWRKCLYCLDWAKVRITNEGYLFLLCIILRYTVLWTQTDDWTFNTVKFPLLCVEKSSVKWFYNTFKITCSKYLRWIKFYNFFCILRISLCLPVIRLCLQAMYQLITRLSEFRTVLRWLVPSIDDKKWSVELKKKTMNVWKSFVRSLSVVNTGI